MPEIDKKTLEHLAKLARIELDPAQEDKFVKDLTAILGHFEELQKLPARFASGPKARVAGGPPRLREDAHELPDHFKDQHRLIEAFPEKENGYLKIPPVFE